MPKEIYNEGRVVGMSAYEIYLRHQLSEYPEMEPVTEREWLSSTLGQGASLILRVPKDTPEGTFHAALPDHSTLCAASNITATIFDGAVTLDPSGKWATCVKSYGQLIGNTSSSHPTTPGDVVPDGTSWTEDNKLHIREYMKIIDGVVYQPGRWTESKLNSPYMDLASPDLNKNGHIKLKIAKKLNHDVLILLTGWVHRPIVAGSTKIEEGAINQIHPWSGDFLGPERFPWAVKITFVVPSNVLHILSEYGYKRQLVSGTLDTKVTAKSVVDYDSADLNTFYSTGDTATYSKNVNASKIPLRVTELNAINDKAAVIAAYQRNDLVSQGLSGVNYPPILYGAEVSNKGEQYMVPLDVGAPGTVKVFDNKQKAINYPKVIPNVYSLWHDRDKGNIYFIDGDNIISLGTELKTENIGTANIPKYASIIQSGDKQVSAISLLNDKDEQLRTDGSSGTIDLHSNMHITGQGVLEQGGYTLLSWTHLLAALGTNKKLDLIGPSLREFRTGLPDIVSGDGGVLNVKGSGESVIRGSLKVDRNAAIHGGATINSGVLGYNATTDDSEFKFNKPIRTGAPYMEFDQGLEYDENGNPRKDAHGNYIHKNPIRLYITNTAPDPTDVPVGSIGIGW